jgi:hypothetical protein
MTRRMTIRVLTLTALCLAAPVTGYAQSVELVYTPGVHKEALALKESLKEGIVHPFDGMSLVGASAERRKSYGDKINGTTAVVIIGEDALKTVADIAFKDTLILVNATGTTAGRGRIIRVFDGSSSVPPGTPQVASTDEVRTLIRGQREVIVRAVLLALR